MNNVLRTCRWLGCANALGLVLAVIANGAAAQAGGDWAISGYAGRMTDNVWFEIATEPDTVVMADVNLVGVSAARRIHSFPVALDLEVEGQIFKYFGDQGNWEINLPAVLRWTRFPWNNRIHSSAAFGLGVSLAT